MNDKVISIFLGLEMLVVVCLFLMQGYEYFRRRNLSFRRFLAQTGLAILISIHVFNAFNLFSIRGKLLEYQQYIYPLWLDQYYYDHGEWPESIRDLEVYDDFVGITQELISPFENKFVLRVERNGGEKVNIKLYYMGLTDSELRADKEVTSLSLISCILLQGYDQVLVDDRYFGYGDNYPMTATSLIPI